MKNYYLFKLLILLVFLAVEGKAQTYQILTIIPDSGRGLLQRVEEYEQERLIKRITFGKSGAALSTLRQSYTSQGLLEKSIQTFHEDYDYDLIREYTYNANGQKTGELFGNNRTGKWGSHRFEYDAQGQVHIKNIYQKNGDNTHQQIYDYQYDAQSRVVVEKRSMKDLETGEVQVNNLIYYSYPQPNRQLTIIKDGMGKIILSEEKNQLHSKRQHIHIIQLGDTDQIKEIITFNSKEQVIQKEEYLNNEFQKSTTFSYDANGIKVLEKYQFPDGTFGGVKYRLVNEKKMYNND